MPRMSRADKILLWTVTPLFVVVFALHLNEAARTGIAQAPFFAAPSEEAGGYPTVGGPRLEHGVDRSGLRVGDRLIRAGDSDLASVGYLGFDAIVVEEAGVAARTPLVYERDGRRYESELELIPYPKPFMRVPFLLSLALMSFFVMLRSPGSRQARLAFLAGMLFAISQLHFFGGSRWQSYASLIIFNFGGAVAMWAVLRWMIEFPEEVPASKRLPSALAWLGALFLIVRSNYIFGGPIPTAQIPAVALATDGVFSVAVVGILTWNTFHAPAVGRRRSKWLLFGLYVTVASMLLALVPSFIEIEGVEFFDSLPYGMLLGAVFPLTMLVALLRYDLFDIDRILSSTAGYSLALAGALLVLVTAAPTVTSVLSRELGLAEQTTLALLAVGLIVIFAPFGRIVSSRVDRIFSPQKRRREVGFQKLSIDLAECKSADEVLHLLTDRVDGLLDPSFATLLKRRGDSFAAAEAAGATLGPWPARGRLAMGLEAQPRLLSMDDRSLQQEIARLSEDERAKIEGKGVRVIVPVRRGKDLVALLCIGVAYSEDIYTSTDLTLLGAAAEKASAELLRLEDSAQLERERERSAELVALKEKAEQADLAKSRFLAAASHDLRQPLHALGLFVDHLGDRVTDEESQELVGKIQESTGALSEMFTALLDLSRLDAGAVNPERTDVEVASLFARLHSELGPQAAAKGLDFVVRCGDEQVHSDAILLTRILRNLTVNAIRYTERGQVELRARRSDHAIEISVADTGPGIPVESQREVFEEFVQLPSSSASRDGIGLGLSIVDRLARVLGHPLTLVSEPEQGTCFTLRLPEADPGRSVVAPMRPVVGSDLSGATIAVLDDDLAILDAMRATLHGWGCRVLVAASLEDALTGIELRGPPDLLLVDYSLSEDVTGPQAIEQIRAFVGHAMPAAIITGETTPEVRAQLSESGLLVLTKPVAPLRLRATIAELLRAA